MVTNQLVGGMTFIVAKRGAMYVLITMVGQGLAKHHQMLKLFSVLCPEDWYLWNGHCYLTSSTKATFDEARQVCKDVNGLAELVSIHDAVEDGKLADTEQQLSYIGLKNEGSSAWRWLDGTPLDYQNWDEGQPGEEQCATLKKNGLWQTQGCGAKSKFHCKLTACKLEWQFQEIK